ncbi:MAG TPA: DUF5671 domain-containing protein [Candidatus Acidoferrales bacterium]|nr:DUF5671 domain-containing protein [Candidatus Acidoferrales bacterium]
MISSLSKWGYTLAVPPSPPILEFVEHAKSAGTADASIVGILTARGWPEKEIYEALAGYYERTVGITIPRRQTSGTAARDAFFYLVIFSTLATWTIGLGSLSFTLIDQWFSDTLFSNGYSGYEVYSVANSLACIIVAFPIYLLVSRSVLRQVRVHPEKLNSPVRKWLTYMALVIAAGVFVGDLITALTYFLRGEITSRFLSEAFVVFVLSGGVFFYYFGGLKRSEDTTVESRHGFDVGMAGASTLVVFVMVALGFWNNGGPARQRMRRADDRRLQDLYTLTAQIQNHWRSPANAQKLPAHLDELTGAATSDPITRQGYEYHPGQGSGYQLCATFSLASMSRENLPDSRVQVWSHPAGHYCFQLDASHDVSGPNLFLY